MFTVGMGTVTRAEFDEIQCFFFWVTLGGAFLFLLGIKELWRSWARPRGDNYKGFAKALIGTGVFVAGLVGIFFFVFWPRF